jgi:lipopolysaccharide transport system ATP-binding protein
VLAVGDQQFQQKCLGKIRSIASGEGRTVLFVSHNLLSVQQLCSRVLRLADGSVLGDGAPDEEIGRYLGDAAIATPRVELAELRRSSAFTGRARYFAAEPDGPPDWQFGFTDPIALTLCFRTTARFTDLELGMAIFTLQGTEIVSTLSSWGPGLDPLEPGEHRVTVRFPRLDLAPAIYRVALGLRSDRGLEDHIPEAFNIQVVASAATTRAHLDGVHGVLLPKAVFTLAPPTT